ncbi:rod shape-determining protein RodA [Phaeodactylibacter xiamenensis]|jgi:rod shape determining protein RodA|uniref:rod shape-determining protein RodA n=1 Tax=Phaeodactylibacter xiamenensis TaxID=1524460 RepID=UPI0024A90553|nr:rod shape-determining protein RodA [Phaeodactylibacter xiamenensis]
MNAYRRQHQGNPESVMMFGRIDWLTFCLFLGLAVIGWMMIFSVSYEEYRQVGMGGFLNTSAGKQAIWLGICGLVFAFIMLFDHKFWQTFAYPIYGLSMLMLVLVLIFGTNIKGATSWFSFGGFSLQPSELAKVGTCLGVSAFLSTYSTDLRHPKAQLTALGLIALPVLLIMLQPDAGSALVFTSFLVVYFREGLNPIYYIVGIVGATLLILGFIYPPVQIIFGTVLAGAAVLAYYFSNNLRNYAWAAIALLAIAAYNLSGLGYHLYLLGGAILFFLASGFIAYQQRNGRMAMLMAFFLILGSGLAFASNYAFNYVLKPHQQDRINVWLQPEKCDERGSLYNLTQSKAAIGSGGLEGKGFLNGTMTKLNYVPEQSTDFIFCTIGEEQGFVGTAGIILLYLLLLLRITVVAERQKSAFARHYAYCVAGILFIHIFINIGMTMGMTPIIGIPLPLISKGGSSLLGFTIMISILLKLDKHRFRH